jgi:hypothetical protein
MLQRDLLHAFVGEPHLVVHSFDHRELALDVGRQLCSECDRRRPHSCCERRGRSSCESPELGPQPARVLLMCFVRVATRTSRLRHSDFSSRDSADGTCTDGRSSRHDTSLRTRASRWSVSRLTSFDCASSALPSSGSFACPARRSRCRQPLHLFLGRVHSTVRCRDLIAPRPAHGPGSPRRARRRPRGTPRRQLPRAIPSARR